MRNLQYQISKKSIPVKNNKATEAGLEQKAAVIVEKVISNVKQLRKEGNIVFDFQQDINGRKCEQTENDRKTDITGVYQDTKSLTFYNARKEF